MEKSPICVDVWEFAWQSWHNICFLEFCEGHTLNVELVVALRAALSVALASETHTTHTHMQKTKHRKS